jgi:signal transduction histidine kinase
VYTTIKVNTSVTLEEAGVPEHLKIIIFRIIQEALNNTAKHSQADTVDVSLIKRDNCIELTVSDNGIGFDVQESALREDSSRGMGLASMEERTDLSGGCFSIDSVKGLGTLIMSTWRLP